MVPYTDGDEKIEIFNQNCALQKPLKSIYVFFFFFVEIVQVKFCRNLIFSTKFILITKNNPETVLLHITFSKKSNCFKNYR